VVDSAGRVMLLGGVRFDSNSNAVPAPEVIWFNPADAGYRSVFDLGGQQPLSLPRIGLSAAAAAGGAYIFAAGGTAPVDGGTALASPALVFFTFDGGYSVAGYEDESTAPSLTPVTRAALAPLGTDTGHLLLAGGLVAGDALATQAQVIGLYSPAVNTSPPVAPAAQRADPCAAVLHDGRVLVVGGQGPGPASSSQVDLWAIKNGSATSNVTGGLVLGRTQHTCTVLADGSVLVTGGVSLANGRYTVLKSIELYAPVPLE
jgi:hypothetical protein